MKIISMAELTYRGLKYTQTKSAKGQQEVHLQYCGHAIMSKRIHEAMKAEMDWEAKKHITESIIFNYPLLIQYLQNL